ncbi:MAG: hypothetical protein MHPSP_003892, partial [Paramarteilia canceri]
MQPKVLVQYAPNPNNPRVDKSSKLGFFAEKYEHSTGEVKCKTGINAANFLWIKHTFYILVSCIYASEENCSNSGWRKGSET